MAILKSAVVLGNANINGEARILKNLTLDSGITSSTNASDTKFWNTNGTTKTASEIVGAGLTMKNDDIQLSGSQLGLNSNLTGISCISGSITISGPTTINCGGGKALIDASNIYIGTGASTGSLYGHGIVMGTNDIKIGGIQATTVDIQSSGTTYLQSSGYAYVAGGTWKSYLSFGSSSGNLYSWGSGGMTIIAGGSGAALELSGTSSVSIKNYYNSGGSININQSGSYSSTTYLWGSVISRNDGIKLATSGSNDGCTLSYDATEECVKFNF